MHRGSSYRGHHGIPAYWPTNPDAEIHVLEPIPPEFILHGWVETPELGAELQAFFDQFTNAQRRVCVGSFDQSFSLSPTPPVRPAWGFPNETVPPIYPEIVTAG